MQREVVTHLPLEHDQRLFQFARIESAWGDLQSAMRRDWVDPVWSDKKR